MIRTWATRCALAALLFVVIECTSAEFLHLYARVTSQADSGSALASVELIRRTVGRVRALAGGPSDDLWREVEPMPFYVGDPDFGYRAAPGKFVATFHRRAPSGSGDQRLETNVTINEDGTRWTGSPSASARRSLIVFGESFMFGTGVSDEQTFGYLVQQARPDFHVRLFALGGYGLTQTLLNFERLRPTLTSSDVIVIGYADWYDPRNVVAPSWLRQIEAFNRHARLSTAAFDLPAASIAPDGTIRIARVHQRCELNNGYCDQPDPPGAALADVSAAIINYIAANTSARVYLLYFDGDGHNRALAHLNDRVVLVAARPADFGSFVRDDIAGFDGHPGPYWHYAMSRKLVRALPPA
jgi:hypothetical protein